MDTQTLILHRGLLPATLQAIQAHAALQTATFQEFPSKPEEEALEGINFSMPDVLLIGELVDNPIRLAQQAQQLDSHLSILLISNQATYANLRQALQLAPFMGPTIASVSNAGAAGLGSVVEGHVQRTRQRRSYTRMKASLPDLSLPATYGVEQVKLEFANRAFEQAPIGILLLGQGERVLSLNPFALQLLGQTEAALLGKPLPDWFDTAERSNLVAFLQNPSLTRLHQTFSLVCREDTRHLDITVRPMAAPGHYRIVLLMDVTEEVTALKAAKASSRQLRMITDALPVLIGYVDNEEKYRFANQAYQHWFHLSPEEILGRTLREVIGNTAYLGIKGYVARALAGERLDYEAWMPYRKEFVRYIRASYIPDLQGGTVVGFYIMVTDVTELKKVQQELEEALVHSQQQNQELQRINADLDNFVYMASHDLRSPIANLEGLLNVLTMRLNGQTDVDAGLLIEHMATTASKLKRTVDDLAQIARAQKQDEEEMPEAVDMEELLTDIQQDIAPLIEEAHPILEVYMEVRYFQFPRKHLRSIFYNLLSNALKYRDFKRQIRVQIYVQQKEHNLEIKVADNGLGLEPNQLEKVFGLFKRLHTHVEGSGVGLYMIKRMVQNYGGRIWAESQKGKGTTFYIHLPLDTNQEEA